MLRTTTRRGATALAAAALMGAVASAPAAAHTEATSSTPRHGAVLDRVPATITVTFNAPIGRLGTTTVTRNRAGNLVRSARVSPTSTRAIVITLKKPGPAKQAGAYRLSWRVIAADGHTVSGVVAFRVRA